MESVFKGADNRWWYAYINESGKNECNHIIGNPEEEREFLKFLGDEPSQYSIFELNKFWGKFKNIGKTNETA